MATRPVLSGFLANARLARSTAPLIIGTFVGPNPTTHARLIGQGVAWAASAPAPVMSRVEGIGPDEGTDAGSGNRGDGWLVAQTTMSSRPACGPGRGTHGCSGVGTRIDQRSACGCAGGGAVAGTGARRSADRSAIMAPSGAGHRRSVRCVC